MRKLVGIFFQIMSKENVKHFVSSYTHLPSSQKFPSFHRAQRAVLLVVPLYSKFSCLAATTCIIKSKETKSCINLQWRSKHVTLSKSIQPVLASFSPSAKCVVCQWVPRTGSWVGCIRITCEATEKANLQIQPTYERLSNWS